MRRRKASGFSGPNPLEWPDIDAFVRRSRMALDPRDIALIEEIDDLYLAQMAAAASAADQQQALADGLKANGLPRGTQNG